MPQFGIPTKKRKPCPKCGREMTEYREDIIKGTKAIGCNGCGFRGPMRPTDAEAVEAWNEIDRGEEDV